MRLLRVYLSAYYILLIGAAVTLWRSGVLARLPTVWIAVAAIVAVGLGIVLALTSPSTQRTSGGDADHE
jgi:energy-coupling factor transporter transmembrane protein EcfT